MRTVLGCKLLGHGTLTSLQQTRLEDRIISLTAWNCTDNKPSKTSLNWNCFDIADERQRVTETSSWSTRHSTRFQIAYIISTCAFSHMYIRKIAARCRPLSCLKPPSSALPVGLHLPKLSYPVAEDSLALSYLTHTLLWTSVF